MQKFVEVILPMALPQRTFTYSVPEELADAVFAGIRVEVQFGKKKVYSAIVDRVHEVAPDYRTKSILSILDDVQLITAAQFKLWNWVSTYYCCSLGEVMIAALPSHLKLSSESKFVFNTEYGEDFSELDDEAYLVSEALAIQKEITLEDVRLILNKKTVFPVIQRLLTEGVLSIREDLQEKFKPKAVSAVRLTEKYENDRSLLKEAFELFSRSERQLECVMAYLTLEKKQPYVLKQDIVDKAVVTEGVLQGVVKKGVLEIYEKEVSRLGGYEEELSAIPDLSPKQQKSLEEIKAFFEEKNTVLLHGVTGSGKTRIYIELMREALAEGKQVLYLLPEIGLTTQIINRLKKVFGNDILPYHSKISFNDRTEVWRSAQSGKSIIIGARSSLFLPFSNLGLVIIDEEHDPSFKQYDPAPRYHARDAAIVLAHFCKAKVLMGSATPALESYQNALKGKYGYVLLNERFGGLKMPEIELVDLKKAHSTKQMYGPFSDVLLNSLKITLQDGEQAILFQNRRGYAPVLMCMVCDWLSECKNCDVSMTYHKASKRLHCHYCNYQAELPKVCPKCSSGKLSMQGTGTEKIEEELQINIPDAEISRMDLDTAGGKNKMAKLLHDFEEKRVDILVGTQMVTKGLDFENVGLVGVISADRLLNIPDFRANERAFQLMVQVAGRAGRKHNHGRVQIQAFNLTHPILMDVINYDYENYAKRELSERESFRYPPFVRLIGVRIQHKKSDKAFKAAVEYAKALLPIVGKRLLGPTQPKIGRIKNEFIQEMLIKIELDEKAIAHIKGHLMFQREVLLGDKRFSGLRIGFDVDPY